MPALSPPASAQPQTDPPLDAVALSKTAPLLMAVFVVVIGLFSTVSLTLNWRHRVLGGNMDYRNLYKAAQRELRGQSLYEVARAGSTFDFIYPPSSAGLLAPLSVAGPMPMAIVLVTMHSVAWVLSALLAVYLVTGRALRQHPLLYVVPVVCTCPYVWDNYILGQPNLVLLAFMLGMFACLKSKRPWTAGALLAVAAAVKAFPIAAIVYLAWRRQWKAVASTLLVLAVLLFVLPAAFRGFRGNWQDVKHWTAGMLLSNTDKGMGQRPDRSYSWQNQSLMGVTQRLVRHVDANLSRKPPRSIFVNIVDITFPQANAVVLILVILIGLAYVIVMPPFHRRTPETDAIEWSMLLLLILIFSPYLFGYFNVWLVLPFTVLTQLTRLSRPASAQRLTLQISLATSLILLVFGLPLRAFQYPQALGNVLWSHLLMFGVLALTLWSVRRYHTGHA